MELPAQLAFLDNRRKLLNLVPRLLSSDFWPTEEVETFLHKGSVFNRGGHGAVSCVNSGICNVIVKKQLLIKCCKGLFEPTLISRGGKQYQLMSLEDSLDDGVISIVLASMVSNSIVKYFMGNVFGMYLAFINDTELRPDVDNNDMIVPLMETKSMMAAIQVMEELPGPLYSYKIPGIDIKPEQWGVGLIRAVYLLGRTLLHLRQYDYTHNDLHTSNVLYRFVPEGVYVRYDIEGEELYGMVKILPVIIDSGRANIRVDAGTLRSEQEACIIEGNRHGHYYPGYDIFTYISTLAGLRKRTPMSDAHWKVLSDAIGFNRLTSDEMATIEAGSMPSFSTVDKCNNLRVFLNNLLPFLRERKLAAPLGIPTSMGKVSILTSSVSTSPLTSSLTTVPIPIPISSSPGGSSSSSSSGPSSSSSSGSSSSPMDVTKLLGYPLSIAEKPHMWSDKDTAFSGFPYDNKYINVSLGMDIGRFYIKSRANRAMQVGICAIDITKANFTNVCCDANIVQALYDSPGPGVAFNGQEADTDTHIPIGRLTFNATVGTQRPAVNVQGNIYNPTPIDIGDKHYWVNLSNIEPNSSNVVMNYRPRDAGIGFSSNKVLYHNGLKLWNDANMDNIGVIKPGEPYPQSEIPIYKYSCHANTYDLWQFHNGGWLTSCNESIPGYSPNYNHRAERTLLVTTDGPLLYVFYIVQCNIKEAIDVIEDVVKPRDVVVLGHGPPSGIAGKDINGSIFYTRDRGNLSYMSHVILATPK